MTSVFGPLVTFVLSHSYSGVLCGYLRFGEYRDIVTVRDHDRGYRGETGGAQDSRYAGNHNEYSDETNEDACTRLAGLVTHSAASLDQSRTHR